MSPEIIDQVAILTPQPAMLKEVSFPLIYTELDENALLDYQIQRVCP